MLGAEAGSHRQYLIMGAWNSSVREQVGGPDIEAEVHFPCNVVVHEDGRDAIVAALDPVDDVDSADDARVRAAGRARGALTRVLERVAG
jgi:hypothetical protein